MAFTLENKLVIGIASSALFDLTESHEVFQKRGLASYRQYQREKENAKLEPGVAFPLINRLLSLNGVSEGDRPVEVILLSRNDPDTGLRVFNSIQSYNLEISRAVFVNGREPYQYLNAFNIALFLSANAKDVRRAIEMKVPAGRVFKTQFVDDERSNEIRIAFDFDGVLVDDASERIFGDEGLTKFQNSEVLNADIPHEIGPFHRFFKEIGKLQEREIKRVEGNATLNSRIRIAIVTARNAPAHKRVVTTLRDRNIQIDDAFFLGGISKASVLKEYKPHIFFDDQMDNVMGAATIAPSAHVPFGWLNEDSGGEQVKKVEVIENAETSDSIHNNKDC